MTLAYVGAPGSLYPSHRPRQKRGGGGGEGREAGFEKGGLGGWEGETDSGGERKEADGRAWEGGGGRMVREEEEYAEEEEEEEVEYVLGIWGYEGGRGSFLVL